ncbi:hypothetical protein Ppha_0038 [Pelodictyon phaeoclathratiforme BU-1]|uniref:Uncharacterized protein n=1 Tax=Pelodictyon phaeoclathratiforme (strain DSM 5477 / BU-1) TaxID=324925 RepID=B4SAM6_PELPB|nr:hypothetical protein Ppha_0038 [Pelodictyon phaeoclathratiforme BU-1]
MAKSDTIVIEYIPEVLPWGLLFFMQECQVD